MQIQNKPPQCGDLPEKHDQKVQDDLKSQLQRFPFSHLMFNPEQSMERLVAHCREVFQAVSFVSKFVGLYQQVLEEKVKQLAECLEQPSDMWKHQKTLFIDIDETLLTRTIEPVPGSETVIVGSKQIHFKVRPHAIEFLRTMERHYDLVLFSASEDSYSRMFFQYFNQKTNNGIKEYLSRDYCIQAYKNIYFKDLRIIQSRNLKDMVLVDNSAFSFGSLIDNGVPIMTYDCSQSDRQLEFLQGYLIDASKVEDVRIFNRERLRLGEMLGMLGSA